jgi:hypothetical protein
MRDDLQTDKPLNLVRTFVHDPKNSAFIETQAKPKDSGRDFECNRLLTEATENLRQ